MAQSTIAQCVFKLADMRLHQAIRRVETNINDEELFRIVTITFLWKNNKYICNLKVLDKQRDRKGRNATSSSFFSADKRNWKKKK